MLNYPLRHIRRRSFCHLPRFERVALAALAALTLLLWSAAGHAQNAPQAFPLPALGADPKATSVSGLSSGAFMASQFHIVHSSTVIGAAIVAGGPFACAESAYPPLPEGPGASIALPFAMAGCMFHTCPRRAQHRIPRGTHRHLSRAWAASIRIGRAHGLACVPVQRLRGSPGRAGHRGGRQGALCQPRRDAIFASRSKPSGHGFITESNGIACG